MLLMSEFQRDSQHTPGACSLEGVCLCLFSGNHQGGRCDLVCHVTMAIVLTVIKIARQLHQHTFLGMRVILSNYENMQMCVHVGMCTCVHACTYVHVCVCTEMWSCMCVCLHGWVCVWSCAHVCLCVCAHGHACLWSHACVCLCVHACSGACVCVCKCM